mgnify:CR=1 FL=1
MVSVVASWHSGTGVVALGDWGGGTRGLGWWRWGWRRGPWLASASGPAPFPGRGRVCAASRPLVATTPPALVLPHQIEPPHSPRAHAGNFDVYVRSSALDRTLMSGVCFFNGVFPPDPAAPAANPAAYLPTGAQVVPVYTQSDQVGGWGVGGGWRTGVEGGRGPGEVTVGAQRPTGAKSTPRLLTFRVPRYLSLCALGLTGSPSWRHWHRATW